MNENIINIISFILVTTIAYKIYSIFRLYHAENKLKEKINTMRSRQNYRLERDTPELSLSGPSSAHIVSYVNSLINEPDEHILIESENSNPPDPTPKTYPCSPPLLTKRVYLAANEGQKIDFIENNFTEAVLPTSA